MNDEITGAALSPDSGKGESIDTPELTDLMLAWADAPIGADALTAYDHVVAHIEAWADSRPAAHVSAPTAAPAHLSPDNNGEGCVSLPPTDSSAAPSDLPPLPECDNYDAMRQEWNSYTAKTMHQHAMDCVITRMADVQKVLREVGSPSTEPDGLRIHHIERIRRLAAQPAPVSEICADDVHVNSVDKTGNGSCIFCNKPAPVSAQVCERDAAPSPAGESLSIDSIALNHDAMIILTQDYGRDAVIRVVDAHTKRQVAAALATHRQPEDGAALRDALTAVDDQLVAILNKADGYWYNKLKAARDDLVRIWLPLAQTTATKEASVQSVPEGWQIVPKVPTPEMINAVANINDAHTSTWATYLAAAPSAPQGESK